MEAIAKPELYAAKLMNATKKKTVALKIISNQQTITELATAHQVSRKFLYQQKHKAISAINDVFIDEDEINKDKNAVLFYLPVTKSWLQQLTISLVLDCHASFRGIIKTMANTLDYETSLGNIFNILKAATIKAQHLNEQEDLKNTKLGAHDELFHHDKPVLAGIDIPSLYCYLLTQEQQRDEDTWAIHLLDLKKKGFNPERIIADDGKGQRAGLKIALPHVPCDIDNFHITKTLIELRRFFRNGLKSAITYRQQLENKMAKAKQLGKPQKYAAKLGIAKKHEAKMQYLSETINTLVSWMEHDVLNKADPKPAIRYELYDFIVEEFAKLEKLHPHRIRAVRITLQNQRNLLLAFTEVLSKKFNLIAEQFFCSVETIWKICELQRYDHNGNNYAICSVPFQLLFKEQLDLIEDLVITAMNETERTSSMVENLNSRLRPYFFLRKEIGHGYLNLLRFYLNHSQFLRSTNPNRVGKSPTEILTGKQHSHWLEMLGFERFKRAA